MNFHLKWFQQLIIYEMMMNDKTMYIASRGQGKTLSTAIFCVTICILYPKTKIIISGPTRKQGNEVLSKIVDDLMVNHDWGSRNLRSEIKDKKVTTNEAYIKFYNGSWMQVVTQSDTSRCGRGNVLITDEFVKGDIDRMGMIQILMHDGFYIRKVLCAINEG